MKTTDETTTYAQMGLAALLPGMQYMIEIMQRQLDGMRAQLADMQMPHKKKGRPKKDKALSEVRAAGARSGWPDTPEERKLEMKRRMVNRDRKRAERAAKAAREAKAAKTPYGSVAKDSPDHDKFRKKMRQVAKARWDNMGVRERKQRLAALQAGRAKKKAEAVTPTVRMAS